MKDLYIIDSKIDEEDDESWEFIGAFKTSKAANSYYSNYKYHNKRTTIVPWELTEEVSSYFDKFIYCEECDKYPYDVENRSVYLIKKNHNGEWHFNCILPTNNQAIFYITNQTTYDETEEYKIIQLKLPYPKDNIHYEIDLERSKKYRANEKKYYDKKDRHELTRDTYKLLKRHYILLKVIIGITTITSISTVLQFLFY